MRICISSFFFFTIVFSQNIGSKKAVDLVLDNLHLYASQAIGKKYIDLFSDDAVFFGTDISERWPKDDFQAYAMARFKTGTGWTYYMKERNHLDSVITLSPVTPMATHYHIRNGAKLIKINPTSQNFQYSV